MVRVAEPDRSRWRRFAVFFALLSVSLEVFYFAILLDTAGFEGYLATLARFNSSMKIACGWPSSSARALFTIRRKAPGTTR